MCGIGHRFGKGAEISFETRRRNLRIQQSHH